VVRSGLVAGWRMGWDNLLRCACELDNTTWWTGSSVSVTPNSVAAPDGTMTADTITPSSSSGYLFQKDTRWNYANVVLTFSVWLRVASGTKTVTIGGLDNGGGRFTNNVTVTTTWQRFSTTGSTTYSTEFWGAFIQSQNNTTPFYAWGAQMTEGSAVLGLQSNGAALTISDFSGLGNSLTVPATPYNPYTRLAGFSFVGQAGVDPHDYADAAVESLSGVKLLCSSAQAWTAVVAAQVPAAQPRVSFGTLLGRASDTAASRTFELGATNTGPAFFAYLRGSLTALPANDALWHVHTIRWDGASASYWMDRGAAVACNVGAAAEETGQRIIVGGRTNGTKSCMSGMVGCVLVYNRALGEREIHRNYKALARELKPRGVTLL
jgi:enamine deaminase RidA (YjgF/YER057c/UK114 family)